MVKGLIARLNALITKDILDHGNETVQEMNNRLHPTHSLPPPSTQEKTQQQQHEGEDSSIQIDWVTVSTAESPEQEVTINWEDGTGEIIDGSTPAIVWEDVTNQLDLDIEVVEAEAGDSGTAGGVETSEPAIYPSVTFIDVATELSEESAKESILAHAPTRNQFLDDVLELEAFLLHRKDDLLLSSSSSSSSSADDRKPKAKASALLDPMQLLLPHMKGEEGKEIKEFMENHTKESVQKQLTVISEISQKFAPGGRLLQLLEIKSSGRYLDRLVGGLQQKQDLIDKSSAGVAAVGTLREGIKQSIQESQGKLDALLTKSRAIKRCIELALSKVYNREVTIVSPFV